MAKDSQSHNLKIGVLVGGQTGRVVSPENLHRRVVWPLSSSGTFSKQGTTAPEVRTYVDLTASDVFSNRERVCADGVCKGRPVTVPVDASSTAGTDSRAPELTAEQQEVFAKYQDFAHIVRIRARPKIHLPTSLPKIRLTEVRL